MNRFPFHIVGMFILMLSSCQSLDRVVTPSDIYGIWGGEGLVMVIGPDGATLEYDCAQGTIDEQIFLDEQGRFQVSGTHNSPNLPIGLPDPPPDNVQPATFSGKIEGRTMIITVILDTTETMLGPYKLTFENPGALRRCL